MISIIDKRATGKTSQLMLLAKEQDGIIVCNNPKPYEQKAIYGYGLTGITFISYQEYLEDLTKGHHSKYFGKKIFIDEIELFLDCISKNSIKGYTLSKED